MKKVLAVVLASVMVLSLAACGGAAKTEEAAAPAATEAAKAETAAPAAGATEEEHNPVTLEVSIVNPEWSDCWYDEIKPKFEAEYPWITLQDVGTGEDKTEFTAARGAANNLPPVCEVSPGEVCWNLVEDGQLLSVSDYEAAKAVPENFKAFDTYNGICYGLPQGSAYDTMYVNMGILNEAGWDKAPTCWDEFIKCCADIKALGVAPILYVGDSNPGCHMLLEGVAANVIAKELGGAAEFEAKIKDGSLKLTDYPEVVERMDLLPQYVLEGSSNYTEDDAIALMTDGECAFAFCGNWLAADMCEAVAEAAGDESLCLMMAPPFNDAGEDCYLSAIPEAAWGVAAVDDPDLEEARDLFFNWILMPENFKLIQNARGAFPVLTTLAEEDIVLPGPAVDFVTQTQSAVTFTRIPTLEAAEVMADNASVLKDFYAGNTNATTALGKIESRWAEEHLN